MVVRIHPLYSHTLTLKWIDIVLNVSLSCYNTYIDNKLCCFIPGKIIDEILKILRSLKNAGGSEINTCEILKELRDLVCMATEHFKKEISIILDKNRSFSNAENSSWNINSSDVPHDPINDSNVSGISQCQDCLNGRRAYCRLNKKYKAVMRKVIFS